MNPEGSGNFAAPRDITQNRPASASPLGSSTTEEMNNVSDEINENGRRSRVQDDTGADGQQARRPRLMNGLMFRNLGLEGDAGRSLYFTFPWRNQQHINHVVLVRVAHLDPTPVATGEGQQQQQPGALQWTLYFLLPQSEAATPELASTTVDPTAVLTEAFAVFHALLAESSLSYEELTRLQEMMGFVNRGVSQEQIDAQLKAHLFKSGDAQGSISSCSICLVDYQEAESLRRLPCSHCYHSECIDKWLTRVNHCPLCRREAVVRTAA